MDIAKRDEIIFVRYIDVVKSPYPYIMKKIIDVPELTNIYNDILDLKLISNKSIEELSTICVLRDERNILEFLKKKDLETNVDLNISLNRLLNLFPEAYIESDLLDIGSSIKMLENQKFVKQIYIHTDEYSEFIEEDIRANFNNSKVTYIHGDLSESLKNINEKITSIMISDILDFEIIKESIDLDYVEILVGMYGYNYYINENGSIELRIDFDSHQKEKLFKLGTFHPLSTNMIEGV